jgi:hypothetical protein
MSPRLTPVSVCRTSRATGPWSAMSAYRELVFTATASPMPAICDVIQLKSFMMLDAFTTSMKCSSVNL